MADRSVQMHAIAGASGVEITGVDLAEDLDDAARSPRSGGPGSTLLPNITRSTATTLGAALCTA